MALTVKTLELKQQDKAVTASAEIQRYNSQMMNSITASLDKVQQDTQARLDNRRVGEIDVQSGADDTGLPVLIVRTTYGAVWDRLPNALAKAGMKVTDSSRPQGTLSVTYKPLNAMRGRPGCERSGLSSVTTNFRLATSTTAVSCSSLIRRTCSQPVAERRDGGGHAGRI